VIERLNFDVINNICSGLGFLENFHGNSKERFGSFVPFTGQLDYCSSLVAVVLVVATFASELEVSEPTVAMYYELRVVVASDKINFDEGFTALMSTMIVTI